MSGSDAEGHFSAVNERMENWFAITNFFKDIFLKKERKKFLKKENGKINHEKISAKKGK